MGEKMGFLFTLAIFAMGLLPMGLDMFTFNVTSSQFLTSTTEMKQLVTEEGGITDRVHYVTDHSTIKYTFKDKDGQTLDGRQNVGDTIYIEYQYDWKGIFAHESLKTRNSVIVERR